MIRFRAFILSIIAQREVERELGITEIGGAEAESAILGAPTTRTDRP